MRSIAFLLPCILIVLYTGCVPIETISNQDFESGIYNLQSENKTRTKVYLEVSEDSLIVYSLKDSAGVKKPDLSSSRGIEIDDVNPGSYFYNSKFSGSSIDIDLSTVITKVRPAIGDVPVQANTNLNGIIYLGAKRSLYVLHSRTTETGRRSSFLRQWGYDLGIFAGLGNTPVNPTTTGDNISLEYDGVVFQKGFAAFITIEKFAIGIAFGFDNLMDSNSKYWIYNNKPWIGIVLAIANF